MQSREDRI